MTTTPFDASAVPVSVTLRNGLGHSHTFHAANEAQAQQITRYYGGKGYVNGTLPNEGATLPLLLFLVFDFRMIGVPSSDLYVFGEGDDQKLNIKLHGLTYKHRLLPYERKNKLPMALKFSRGAKQTDGDERKTGDDNFTYIQSVNFVGEGFIPGHLQHLAVPGSLDERGNIKTIYNQLPGEDNELLMRHFAERHFKGGVPPLAGRLQTPTQPRTARIPQAVGAAAD